MRKEKTIEDYNLVCTKAKMKYQKDKMNYNWNYTFKEEILEGINYFLIANYHMATKIIFDHESNFIVEKEIYTMDINSIQALQKEIK